MPLIVEDGSGVPGANSYVTIEEAREYAASRGISFPANDAELEVLLVNGFDYVESFARRYQGAKAKADQETAWPRSGVVIEDYYLPSNIIPRQLKYAQIRAAEATGEIDLMPVPSNGVVKEKIDVLEFEYAEPSVGGEILDIPKVMTHLDFLFYRGGGFRVKVVRG